MALLRGYFEATDEEREQGLKQPSRAHQAIAELVAAGAVKVIITTNFDRLLEQALAEVGVAPVVVSGPDAAEIAPPYAHTRCLVIKVHGDYLDSRLLNTESELLAYDPRMSALIARIVADHGMVICGWSGQWDPALRAILLTRGHGIYTDHWVSRADPAQHAIGVIEGLRAEVHRAASADDFFVRLLEQVRSLQDLSRGQRLSDREVVATTKRLIARPGGAIALSDLLADLEAAVRDTTADVGAAREGANQEGYARTLDAIERVTMPLAGACATVARWGSDADISLVEDVIRRLGSVPSISGNTAFLALRGYPAALALYASGTAATTVRRYVAVDRLLRVTIHADGRSEPAHKVLAIMRVLDHQALNLIELNHAGQDPAKTRRRTPISDHVARILDGALHDVVQAPSDRGDFFDVFEVLLSAVAEIRSGEQIPGRFMWRTARGHDAITRLLMEGMDAGDEWGPVRQGLFASLDEFKNAILRVKETYRAIAW